LLLGYFTIEEVKIVLQADSAIETVAIILTAFFTLLAANAARKSAMVSQKQLEANLNSFEQERFNRLLDSLEKAHNITFLTRGSLYSKLCNDIEAKLKHYKSLEKETNKRVKKIIDFDNNQRNSSDVFCNNGKDSDLFKVYFEYACEISLLFEFDYIVLSGNDFVKVLSKGSNIPIYNLEPDRIVYVADAIANEILGFNIIDIHLKGYGVGRKGDFDYFEAFKIENAVEKLDSEKRYQYIEAKE